MDLIYHLTKACLSIRRKKMEGTLTWHFWNDLKIQRLNWLPFQGYSQMWICLDCFRLCSQGQLEGFLHELTINNLIDFAFLFKKFHNLGFGISFQGLNNENEFDKKTF